MRLRLNNMFGIFKRVDNLERLKSAMINDYVRLQNRVAALESYHVKVVLRETNRQNKELFNGAIVAVGSGRIKPVQTEKPKTKKPTVKKKPDTKNRRRVRGSST